MTTKNNIPAGYKDSAVGIIPQEWEVKALGEAYKLQGGYAFKSELFADIGIPIVRISNLPMDSNIVDITDCVYYPNTESIKEQFIIKQGMLLIAMSGATTGKTAVYNSQNSSYLNQRVGMFCSKNDNITYNYLLQLVQSPLYSNALKPLLIAGAQPNIAPSDVENMKFPVPPLAEQRKIAEILGVWDEAIEKQSRLIEKLELRKRALMQRLLTGRTRLPGFTTPWQKVKLGEIGKFDKGVGVPKEKIVSEGCKAITYGEIYTKYDYVIKDFASYIDSDTAQTSKQISSGAILFAGSGETLEDIGKCVAFIDNDKAYAGGDIIIFNPTIEVDSLVLSYILNSPIAIAQKRRYGQGHSVVHIYQKDLARIEFELPSLPEQKAIAEVLTTADNEIATHRKKLDALRLQKRGLMQQLLTGKTRVKM